MKTHPHHPSRADRTADIARLRVVVAGCRVWVCEILLWMAECFGAHAIGRTLRAELHGDRRALMQGLRGVLVLMAMHHVAATPPDFNATPYLLRAPRGFAVSRQRGSEMRHLTRCVGFGARGLRDCFARLRAVMETLDACAAKVARLLARSFRQRGPRVVRPEVHIVRALTALVPTCADTS